MATSLRRTYTPYSAYADGEDDAPQAQRLAQRAQTRQQAVARTPLTMRRPTAPGSMPASGGVVGSAAAPSPSAINPVRPASPLVQPNTVRRAPPTPTPGPGVAPGHGGIDVNSYVGSAYGAGKPAERMDRLAPPTSEEAADRILRARFGAPPNERGQIDTADKNGSRSIDIPADAGAPTSEPGTPTAAPTPAAQLSAFTSPGSMAPTTGLKPAPPAPQQTERANPLSGANSPQPEDTDEQINNAHGTGFIQRGRGSVPAGSDALPAASGHTVGGTGVYARRFSSPQSAQVYGNFVRRIFGDQQIA